MGIPVSKSSDNPRWRRRKEARPAEILSAALQVFADKGFMATRLDEVAKAAGVSKGTLYLYFENKEALFKAVVNEFVLPRISQAEQEAEQYNGSVKDLMSNMIEQWWSKIGETDLCGIPKIIIAEAANFPELAQYYVDHVIKRVRRFVAQLIQLGIERGEFRQCDPDYVARTFITPLVFAAIWERSLAPHDKQYDAKKYLRTHLEIFLHGITVDGTA